MNRKEIIDLLHKYDKGLCNETEMALLETWYTEWNIDKSVNLSDKEMEEDLAIIRKKTFDAIHTRPKTFTLWPRLVSAAAILVVIGTGWFFLGRPAINKQRQQAFTNDLAPGSTGATLTLASGKKIRLGSTGSGELAKEAGVTIKKTAAGDLIYELSNPADSTSGKMNTLSTTNGETYRVRLQDKTEIWLNAASQLRYPATFRNEPERRVELSGEAYFQVATDKSHPFIVKTNRQQIKVLGTHFNIKGYENEPVKTTLVEGSVEVSNEASSKLLKPGQQSMLFNNGNFVVGPSDVVLDLAWKNNEFMFESESIENVMKMVERWYNVEVIYVGKISSEKFGGGVSRFENVSKVLALLERTGAVKFKIENRKIFVKSVTGL